MSHAQVEELSDSDPDIDDPSSYLAPSDPSIISRADIPTPALTASNAVPKPPQTILQPQPSSTPRVPRETVKHYCSIYPVYFDSSRTRKTGRRVSSKLAIPNPLAYNIIQTLPQILAPHMLPTAFEPDKTHPKDWSNPGRIRVQLFDKDTHRPLHPDVHSKSHLFVLIARYLQQHPTQSSDPLHLKIPGLSVPAEGGLKEPAAPRGWKLNTILPQHSPAVSGGGVSDNFFKEAMEELRQAQLEQQGGGGSGSGGPMAGMANMMNGMGGMMSPSGGGGMGTGAPKKKKDKKRVEPQIKTDLRSSYLSAS